MVKGNGIGPALTEWAKQERSIEALVMIGSRARSKNSNLAPADDFSDWDFQIVSSRPDLFASRAWLVGAGLGEPLAYAVRLGRLGTATKVSIVLMDGEVDLVVLPVRRLWRAKILLSVGLAKRFSSLSFALGGLSTVLRGGYQVMIDRERWARFFQKVADEFPPLRLGDDMIAILAEGFVCDFISTRQKISRGEFLAAQRWLHIQLVETNFQLLHELKQRRGESSLPDGRRIERLSKDAHRVAVSAVPSAESLNAAVAMVAEQFKSLMGELLPDWHWPELEVRKGERATPAS